MRRTRYRIFGDAIFRRKETADNIDVASRNRNDHAAQIEPTEQSEIGGERANCFLAIENRDVIAR
jgi:hypothetical protein